MLCTRSGTLKALLLVLVLVLCDDGTCISVSVYLVAYTYNLDAEGLTPLGLMVAPFARRAC